MTGTRTLWRMVKARHAATAFSGEGAAIAGGRWNSRGIRMVYTSAFQSLAVLETLVHFNPQIPLAYVLFRVELEASLVEKLTPLPDGWQEMPVSRSSQQAGDRWIAEQRSVALEVPSTLVPDESNLLLNPAHPDFGKVTIGPPEPFAFDARLIP
ncbi:MAG TPA: RES family NAD+ phosphorylase [Chthoniobacteraceae bacterium]|nr:RES family NAD+ phosphorylase [Chthoniobacteraceae bacterium]